MPVRIEGESIENIYSSEESAELSPKKLVGGSMIQNAMGSKFRSKMDGPPNKTSNNRLSVGLHQNLEKKMRGKLDPIEPP